jgi:two-component system chemotaxis response regulator CheY
MKHCLVIDDSRAIRAVARRIIEGLEYSVTEAADGPAGLRVCRETMPDLIMLDWNLPAMAGMTFVRALRAQPGGQRPFILFCATENDAGKIAQARAAGANECILKPFDGASVRAKLVQVGVIAA